MACIRVLQVGMSTMYGGTEAFLMSVYRNIDRSKVQFDFLNIYEDDLACKEEIEAMGGRILRLDSRRRGNLKNYFKNMESFFQKYGKDYDIIHCNYQGLHSIDMLSYAKKFKIPVRIAHIHNSGHEEQPDLLSRILIKYNEFKIKRVASHFFACSQLASTWAFGNTDSIIINNAIEVDDFRYSQLKRAEKRRELGLESNFVVGNVGRLVNQKNLFFLIDIFYQISLMLPHARLILVGEGKLREQLEKRVEELEIKDRARILGARSDVKEIMQAMDVFVLPSIYEGLGIVLIESQAAGLRSFTSAKVVPESVKITDLLDFIALEEGASRWAEIIVEQALDYERRDMAEQVREAGYDIKTNAKKLEQMYLDFFQDSKGK